MRDSEQFRYLFLVRQNFNEKPVVDAFYKLQSPDGMTGDEMKVMTTLKPGWETESLKADTSALHGMSLRLRFNSDMYPKVCLVRTEVDIDAKELTNLIQMYFKDGTLDNFLKESAIK